MTAEQQVKARHPEATAEAYSTFDGRDTFVIFDRSPRLYGAKARTIGEGKTEAKAWVDAAKKLAKAGV